MRKKIFLLSLMSLLIFCFTFEGSLNGAEEEIPKPTSEPILEN